LDGVATFDPAYSRLKLDDRDDAEVEVGRTLCCDPASDRRISAERLAELTCWLNAREDIVVMASTSCM
jgi:hypothetical protein